MRGGKGNVAEKRRVLVFLDERDRLVRADGGVAGRFTL